MDDINSYGGSDSTSQPQNQNGQNQYGQGQYGQGMYGQGYGQIPDPRMTTSPAPITTPPKKSVSKAAVATVIVILVIIGVMIASLAPSYLQATKFGKAAFNDKSSDKMAEVMFPESISKHEGEIYDGYKSAIMKEFKSDILLMSSTSYMGVKPGKSISKSDLKVFEKYYDLLARGVGSDDNIKIQKGIEYKIKFKAGGVKYYCNVSAIKIKGEGWKICPVSPKEMKDIAKELEAISNLYGL